MRFRLPHIFLTLAATACALAAPAAHAFTVENKDEGGQYGVPKFNLEEQAKNFRKDGSDVSSTGKSFYETPLGSGTLHFGVTQGPVQLRLDVKPRPRSVGIVAELASGVRPQARATQLAGIQQRSLSALRPPSPSRAV